MKTSNLKRFTYYLPDELDINLDEVCLMLKKQGYKVNKSEIVMTLLGEGLAALSPSMGHSFVQRVQKARKAGKRVAE